MGSEIAGGWAAKLSGNGPNARAALLDWLRTPVKRLGSRALRDMQRRIDELRNGGADHRPALSPDRTHAPTRGAHRPSEGSDAAAPWRAAENG